jgi:hypothetical protein
VSEPTNIVGNTWYAPNQQAVRGDESGPAEEGDGGSPPSDSETGDPKAETATDYDSMTKAELIELAQGRGISPANNDMTKAELVAALEGG